VYDGEVQTQKQICGNLFFQGIEMVLNSGRGSGGSYGGIGGTEEWNLWGRLY